MATHDDAFIVSREIRYVCPVTYAELYAVGLILAPGPVNRMSDWAGVDFDGHVPLELQSFPVAWPEP